MMIGAGGGCGNGIVSGWVLVVGCQLLVFAGGDLAMRFAHEIGCRLGFGEEDVCDECIE